LVAERNDLEFQFRAAAGQVGVWLQVFLHQKGGI
jgi:hypothetical protein